MEVCRPTFADETVSAQESWPSLFILRLNSPNPDHASTIITPMFHLLESVQNRLYLLLAIYLCIQLLYIIFLPLPFQSDSLEHFRLAQECLNAGRPYPLPHHRFDDYILAPLYINFIAGLLCIHNSASIVLVANLVLNFLQLLLVYKISKQLLAQESWARLTVVLYVFYLANLGLILLNLTELAFGVLSLASFHFYLKHRKRDAALAGVLLALAISVRPFGWALLLAYLSIYLWQCTRRQALHAHLICLMLGLSLTISSAGLITRSYFGDFVFTSTTGPSNLLMGANDFANGAYNKKIFEPGRPGFIPANESTTYVEKGDFWLQQAGHWIQSHPAAWFSLFPLKLLHMFGRDDWAINTLTHSNDWNLYRVGKIMLQSKDPSGVFAGESLGFKLGFITIQILHHVYYFGLLAMMLHQFYFLIKNKMAKELRTFAAIYLFALYGIGINLLTVGDPRYKYPYIIWGLLTMPPALARLRESLHK